MMVMEMVIMAVFMIAYMMNPAGLMPMSMVHNRRGSLADQRRRVRPAGGRHLRRPRGRTGRARRRAMPRSQLGEALMGPQMLTMVTLGFTLFATMVGAVVLATHRGRYDRFGDDLKRRPPADPARGGVGR